MINSVNTASQAVAVGSNVLFNVDSVRTRSCRCGGWLHHDLGSGLFNLTKQGIYEVSYSANITSDTTGNLTLGIHKNGEEVSGSSSTYTVGTASAVGSVYGQTLINIPCGASATISIANNSSIAMTVTDPSIIIKKVA